MRGCHGMDTRYNVLASRERRIRRLFISLKNNLLFRSLNRNKGAL